MKLKIYYFDKNLILITIIIKKTIPKKRSIEVFKMYMHYTCLESARKNEVE